jgi:uncharacterized protein (TIGR02266 family)
MTDRRRRSRRTRNDPVVAERRVAERRRGDRRGAARAPLDLWVEEEKGDELYFRRTGNLSLGGLSFEHTIPHAPGTQVRLRFALPGASQRIIEAHAEVVTASLARDGLGMGLRFCSMGDDDRRALQAFLDASETTSRSGADPQAR